MKSRFLVAAAISVALAVGFAAPAFAEGYTGELNANSSAAGGTVVYTSDNTGETAGTSGEYSLTNESPSALGGTIQPASLVTRTVSVSANSSLRFSVTIPKTAKVGSVYKLNVTVGKFADTKTISVVGAPLSSSPAGFNGTIIWVIAAILVVLLIVLFFILRRRRHTTA
jgi:hypothetical protein